MALVRSYVEDASLPARFQRFLQASGRSAATQRAYLATVRRYEVFAGGLAMDDHTVLRYVATRRDRVRQSSLNIELCALRAWDRWMRLVDATERPPLRIPKQKRPPCRVVRALSDAEVGMLLAAPDLTTYVGFRDHVIIATIYQCGLRASEVAALQMGSIQHDGTLLVCGKGGKWRHVPFGESWGALVDRYIGERGRLRPGKRSALFLTRHGTPLRDGRSIWVIVDRYARRALGLSCGYTRLDRYAISSPWQGHYPHLLRAAFATELHQRGCNLVAIAEMLGHASAETTAAYLATDMRQLREAAARHPRARRATDHGSLPPDTRP